MRRKVPVFRVNAKPGASYEVLTEVPGLKEVVIEETVLAIKEGIRKKKKSTPIFEIAGSNCYLEIEKDKWKLSLENAIEYYVEREDYNKCIECRDLISKL
jgi:hypothetical protein